jgi:hypothetical protein
MENKTLNDPLSGEEIKTIILHRISQSLDKDCTLKDDISYASFALEFDLRLRFDRSLTPGTALWGSHSEGHPTLDLPVESIHGTYDESSPNRARLDHDLPIPVEVATPNGPQKRKIKFDRPELLKKES